MPLGSHNLYSSQPKHLPSIAACHILCFPQSLANKLGKAYVAKTLHWFLVSEKRFLFHIALPTGEVIGYCGGFVPKGIGDGSSSGMLQHAFKEAVLGIIKKPWLAFHKEVRAMYPFLWKNIKGKLVSKKNKPVAIQSTSDRSKYSGLVVIGVHPEYRGTGIFNELMEQFFEESKRLGVLGSKLSVKKENGRGISAYQKFGWEIEEEHEKTWVFQKLYS